MSNYLPKKPQTLEYEGDIITFEVSSMDRQDFQKMVPFMDQQEDGTIKMSFKDKMVFAEQLSTFLPTYIHNFVGLKDGNGDAVALEVVVKDTYFMDLAQKLLTLIFAASKMDKDTAKKSEEPSEQESQG